MARGVRKNKLTKSALAERLGLLSLTKKELDKAKLVDLLKQAVQQHKLTEEELQNSLPTSNSVIKCYLRSIVNRNEDLERIDKYVQIASLLYARGSFIANLLAHEAIGEITKCSSVPRYNTTSQDASKDLFDFIESAACKQVFLPERWPTSKTDIDHRVQMVVEENKATLDRLYPSEWRDFMNVTAWDQVLNRMYSKYRANVEVHVKCHLMNYLSAYLDVVQKTGLVTEGDEAITKAYCAAMRKLFTHPLHPSSVVHTDDYETVVELRTAFGMEIDDYAPTTCDYNQSTFHMFMYLVRNGVTNGTYLPVSTIGRKYAYVDGVVAKHLVPEMYKRAANNHPKPSLSQMFGLTPAEYRSRRKRLRQQLRRKYAGGQDPKSCKLRRKWRRIGCSNMPKDAMVFSFETDGVGVSICIQRPKYDALDERNEEEDRRRGIAVYKKGMTKAEREEARRAARISAIDAVPKTAVFVGVDLGRAKAFTAAVAENPLRPPTTVLLTRNAYYNSMRHNQRIKFQKERNATPAVAEALEALSLTPKTDFPAYLGSVAAHFATLKDEYIGNKDYALWKMRLYRSKKQALDKSVQKIFDRGKGKPLCIGIGDAKLAPTGRHERAMPTCQIMKAFMKAKARYKNEVHFRSINEFRTTLCCCACGSVTKAAPVTAHCNDGAATRPSRRLRLCTECNKTDGRRRDRDVQAARNMLWLTQHEVLGEDCRPWYLCRPRRIDP